MTCSWIIHILWNMLLHALLGTVVPLQFTLHYRGRKMQKLKKSKFSSGLHNQLPKCLNISLVVLMKEWEETHTTSVMLRILFSPGVFSVNCLYEVIFKESRLCVKHVLSSCITTQSIIKSDGSSGRTQENRALNATFAESAVARWRASEVLHGNCVHGERRPH